jgi:hypothetical protein
VLTGEPAEGGQPGYFRQPGPLGVYTAGAGSGSTLGTGPGGQASELNVAGQFDWNPTISDADEIAELTAGRWMPQTNDFVAVAGGTVPVAPTFGNFLGAILQRADGGISRLNLFSHGDKSLVAFGGTIQKRSIGRADVSLNTNGPNDNMTAMDPTSMANLNQPGVSFTAPTPIHGKKDFTVADVRKKFTETSFIVLYLCHSAQDLAFLKLIAKFFGVKVIGFNNVVGYYPPTQTSPARFQRNGEKVGIGFGAAPAQDFRTLTSDPSAIVATP